MRIRTNHRGLARVGLALATTLALLLTAGPANAATVYAAIGDSVAAGLGNPARSAQDPCYQSTSAYPYIVAKAKGASLYMYPCSGATIPAGIIGPQNLSNGTQWPAQLPRAKAKAPTRLTVTIGANDLRWDEIIRDCYLWECTARASQSGTAENAFSTRLRDFRLNLENVLKQIASWSPRPVVIITNYYWLFPASYPSAYCNQLNPYPGISISANEFSYLKGLLSNLNSVISGTASNYGARLADIRAKFVGHDLCSSSSYIFPFVRDCNYSNCVPPRTFHPNGSGQSAIATAVQAKW